MVDDQSSGVVCRICLDGNDAETLVAPCGCSGTQAVVHEACLLRWRRIQLVQGKLTAAQQCGICRQKYHAALSLPRWRPLHALCLEVLRIHLETFVGLVYYLGCLNAAWSFHGLVLCICLVCGVVKAVFYFCVAFTVLVLFLYSHGMKLSVLGGQGQRVFLGITSFGAPVEGLSRGMLLVSLDARGPFDKTVLYILEYSDGGSLGLILNSRVEGDESVATLRGEMSFRIRSGGPVQAGLHCIHTLRGFPGAEQVDQAQQVFVNRGVGSLHAFVTAAQTFHRAGADAPAPAVSAPPAAGVFVKGVSSWGAHQLDGEIRRRAWGWIRPEHVRLGGVFGDVRAADPFLPPSSAPVAAGAPAAGREDGLRTSVWEHFVNAPDLEIYLG